MHKDPMAHPKANPIASAEQYGLMAAIASGATLRQDVGISQELAREMIRKTPRRLRSKFAAELAQKRPKHKRNNSIMNPSAEELTETWHGRPPEEVIDYEEEEVHESDAAVLAELEELAIILENKEDTICIEFGEDPPMLVANVSTGSLELLGGDQHLDFGEGWDTSKSEVSIGHIYLIAYCTDKHHLEGSTGKPESYEHFFGEEYYKSRGYKVSDYKDTTKATASEQFFDDILEDGIVEDAITQGYLPTMVYDTVNEKVRLVGGRYTVEDVGLKD